MRQKGKQLFDRKNFYFKIMKTLQQKINNIKEREREKKRR